MHKRIGLTLIELMVGVLIIALIATIGLVSFKDARAKARDAKRLYDITQYAKALQLYAQDHSGQFPAQNGFLGRGGILADTLRNYLPTQPADSLDTGSTLSSSYYYYYVAANSCQNGTVPTVHVQNMETSNPQNYQNPCPLGAGGSENGYANQAAYLLIVR